jgi:acetyl-CoA C-acetyltransferase
MSPESAAARLPANTPVIVGAGQYTERLDSPGFRGLSAVDLAAEAARCALREVGEAFLPGIDLVMTTRTFEDSVPVFAFEFGRSNNFPRSICRRLGCAPAQAVWADAGGNTPQELVAEACERIAAGEVTQVLVCGAENISTARHFKKQGIEVDWSEEVDGQVDDRFDPNLMLSEAEIHHGLITVPQLYGVLENARRARLAMDRDSYRADMARWFAPLTAVAARNTYASMANRAYSADELAAVNETNRMIADPYPRLLVSRDQVNQGAAVLVTSAGRARELAIDPSRWIYLHGYARAVEKPLPERPDLGAAPSAGAALGAALAHADLSAAEIDCFDFYSCFPIAVSNACDALGLRADDARGLTLTGGLPYFGGPGNNYSMHAIAEAVARLRATPDARGLVAANGGFLSKYAVGIYGTEPRPFRRCDSAGLQRELDAVAGVALDPQPEGEGVVETYTVSFGRDGAAQHGMIFGRLAATGCRFLAAVDGGDAQTLSAMAAQDPLRRRVIVEAGDKVNRFRFT